MDTAEPAAGRMTRVERDAKSELVLYKRMKRNGHNHPVMAKGEVKNGRISWRLFRIKEPGRVSTLKTGRRRFILAPNSLIRDTLSTRGAGSLEGFKFGGPRAFHVNEKPPGCCASMSNHTLQKRSSTTIPHLVKTTVPNGPTESHIACNQRKSEKVHGVLSSRHQYCCTILDDGRQREVHTA